MSLLALVALGPQVQSMEQMVLVQPLVWFPQLLLEAGVELRQLELLVQVEALEVEELEQVPLEALAHQGRVVQAAQAHQVAV